jgi:ABC-type polysaccharide/polyol phosphate transport system ATPase subunit
MVAIETTRVTKVYRRFSGRRRFGTLKSALLRGSVLSDLHPAGTFAAVKDVSFKVPQGATYGVIGRNGSGKSTMLKLVAGITKPTEGTVAVNGRVSALIELGAGFHPEISGRENVFINGIMLGLTKREIARRFDEIVDFAGLRDFIEAPVKTYSSGMYVRLGFAVAINVDPDVLLVDEVLAVGDEAFTHKCLDKFAEFRRRGKTILLVTHSLSLVEKFCDDVLWLDAGAVRGDGDPRRVVSEYLTDVAKGEDQALAAQVAAVPPAPAPEAEPPADMFTAGEGRWGSREIEIVSVRILGGDGAPRHVFESGEPAAFEMVVRTNKPVGPVVFGVSLFNADGVCCYGTNTSIEDLPVPELHGDQTVTFRIRSLDMVEGSYKLDVAAHREDGYPYDYHRLLHGFRVNSRTKDIGIFRPPHSWEFTTRPGER